MSHLLRVDSRIGLAAQVNRDVLIDLRVGSIAFVRCKGHHMPCHGAAPSILDLASPSS